MILEEYGYALHEFLKDQLWFQAVGIAEPNTLYVYLCKRFNTQEEYIEWFKKSQQFKPENGDIVFRYAGPIELC